MSAARPRNSRLAAAAAAAAVAAPTDRWVPVSAGHQVSETGGSSGSGSDWRAARVAKLAHQFEDGCAGGDQRLYDNEMLADAYKSASHGGGIAGERVGCVGKNGKDLRQRDLRQMLAAVAKPVAQPAPVSKSALVKGDTPSVALSSYVQILSGRRDKPLQAPQNTIPASLFSEQLQKQELGNGATAVSAKQNLTSIESKLQDDRPGGRQGLLDGVTVYVNGSTLPLVSDHRLKQIVTQHGGRVVLHLARRQVTHVVVGRPSVPGARRGAGGGLAGRKLETEIRRAAGCSVKIVDVEWILESVRAGKRLPEARFATLKVARQGQPSVYERFVREGGRERDSDHNDPAQSSAGR